MRNALLMLEDLIHDMDSAASKGSGDAHYAYKRLIDIRTSLLSNTAKPSDVTSVNQIPDAIGKEILRGAKINAIKEFRGIYNVGLKEAKDGVEDWIARFYPSYQAITY